jgi:Trk-type K+ transport system membrane component
LVTVGDADYVEQDWTFMFGKLGVLDHDTSIAAVVRLLGWLGMMGVVVWLWWKWRASTTTATRPKAAP